MAAMANGTNKKGIYTSPYLPSVYLDIICIVHCTTLPLNTIIGTDHLRVFGLGQNGDTVIHESVKSASSAMVYACAVMGLPINAQNFVSITTSLVFRDS